MRKNKSEILAQILGAIFGLLQHDLGDRNVADGGGADEGDGTRSPCRLGVVVGIEGDLVVGLLERLGVLYPQEDSVDISRDPLKVAVGEWGLCPAADACHVRLRLMIAPDVLLGRLLAPNTLVWHSGIHLGLG